MEYRYLETEEIKRKLEKENYGTDISDRLNKFLSSHSPMSATSLMADLLVSKFNNHSGLRFVWFREIRKDVCLYILRRIYKHDEYSKKLTDATKQSWRERHALTASEADEVNAEFAKYFKEAKKDILPEEYRKYEESRAFDKNRDVIFYEMPLWHEGMKKVPKDYWPFIQKAISEDILINFSQCDVFFHHTTNNYTITYRFGKPNAKSKSDVYLLQITNGKEPNLDELLDRKYDCEIVDDLQNYSSKCYPDYYTYDYESWKNVEEDDMANLALTEEEIKVLQDVQFPFFVSGLAGSGKSTILYYLYANVYKYVAIHHPEHKLLFLSYNDDLVEKARRSVKSILCYHSSNEGFADYFTKEENEQHFKQCFVPFRDFLKDAFLNETSIARFSEDKHITYEKFRELYKKEYLYGGKRLSPSILWSVIRTFIKGRDLAYFTPQDYNSDAITRGDKTVDPKVYEEAYRIWNKWYRHYNEDKGFWDDLDLVRYALTNGDIQNVFHNYSVIFCDEAQDFTKLEIDLILSLSKHSEYKLSYHPEDQRIPIAFAGDPNQTINPTGFRWAGTKAIFNKSFEESLDSYPELSTPELSKNYRSQLGIVKFANTIQTIRYKHFDETSKGRKLQSVREDPKGENKDALEYVGFYSYDKYKDIIVENLPNANIITSGDGEEGDVVDYPEISDGNVKLNTAIGTKGLEYDGVMLYKFCSDTAHKLFQKIVAGEPFADDSERFEIAHFFTKLYIAVSRAKSQLFIVDTDESYEAFWKYFTDHELWEKLIERYVCDTEKRKLVGHVTLGDIETLPKRLSDSYDAEENGRQEFEKAKGNPPSALHMRRARSYFLESGLTALADECDAYLFLYAKKFEKAGDKFLSLKQEDKRFAAVDAYWKGKCWKKLVDVIGRKTANDSDSIKLLAAKFMTHEMSGVEFVNELVSNRDNFQNAMAFPLKDMEIWTVVFDTLKDELESLQPINITIVLTQKLDFVSKYIKWFDKGLAHLRADLYFANAEFNNEGFSKNNEGFRTESYGNAIKIWEEVGEVQGNVKYYKAKKAACKSVSEEIIWMEKLGEVAEIISKYGDVNTESSLTEDAQSIVFNCLIATDMAKALAYPYPKDSDVKWNTLYMKDRANFLRIIILKEFSQDKFEFLKSKVEADDANIFQSKTPSDIFDLIFALEGADVDGKPYWVYFVADLKDRFEERVFKNRMNRDSILEALGKIIKSGSEISKPLATCFLEMLFDEEYNPGRAKKYVDVLCDLFKRDLFFKEDFRAVTKRNAYFTQYCPVTVDDIDRIKGNIHKFAHEYLVGINKVTNAMLENVVKPLFMAFEISVPYINLYPNYADIYGEYRKFLNDKELKKTFGLLSKWTERRLAFNMLLADAQIGKSTFAQIWNAFKNQPVSLEDFVHKLSKEDTIAFIIATNRTDCDYSYDSVLISAKTIYAKRLRREDFRPYCSVNQLRDALSASVDQAIKELLSDKSHVKEYEMKLLAFVWEALGDHSFAAAHYDDLIGRKRLDKVTSLKTYFKRRALLHYSYMKQKDFEEKQQEYNVTMTNLPATYPKIVKEDESVPQVKITETTSVSEETKMPITAKKSDSTGSALPEPTPQVLSDKSDVASVPASKEAAIRMIEEANMTDEQIMQIMMRIKQLTKA